mgnify:FL=1
MGKKILDSKALYVVLSICLSFSAWLFVISKDGTRDRAPYRNLPVEFTGVEMLEERGLMIVSKNVTASITVRATPRKLAILNKTPPRLVGSVSNINLEGTHSVSYTVELPNGVSPSDVEITYGGLGGSTVDVEVARALSRKVRIEGEFQGSVAEGYLAGDKDDFRFDPAELTISGQAELVNQVSYARVTVTEENLTENVGGAFPFQLIGASGDPLDLDVNCDVDVIYTSFPIRATAEVPLNVKVIEGGGLKRGDVDIGLSAPSIMVAGSREAVAALVDEGEISLGSIDLAELDEATIEYGGELTFPVPLPDELENISGFSEVKVTVRVLKRVETRTFDVTSRIRAINVPEGWEETIITQAVQVKVRGTKALLDGLTEESILVVADLQKVTPAAGRYTVPASIYLNSASSVSDLGVVNPNGYNVVVSLARGG